MAKKIKFLCSLQKKENKKQGRWSQEEQDRFLKGCYFFKNDWEKIKDYIKTRTIPQIRSHAQKYLIKICRKYSIKLSKKKFSNRLSKHLDITKMPYKGKSNISNMSIYEKNILEMFNYYNRELIQDEKNKESSNNFNINQFNYKYGFGNFNNSTNINNININIPRNPININNLNYSINLENNKNILENKNENLNNNFLLSLYQFKTLPSFFTSNNLQNIQISNKDIKSTSPFPPPTNQNSNNTFYNLYNYNSSNINYINNFSNNNFFIQNEYEFHLMQNISYYNSLLLNYIKTNQKINDNILMLLGYDFNKNIDVNNYNVKINNKEIEFNKQ